MSSLARQNYNEECEAAVNKHINMELSASYLYMSIAFYFDREDVSLENFYKYFKKASDKERHHAEMLLKYQNERGGRIVFQDIKKPTSDEWGSPMDLIKVALDFEKLQNQSLIELEQLADRHNDPHLSDFIEDNFLHQKVHMIKELSDHVTNLTRVGKGLGEFMFDKSGLSE